MLQNTFLIFIFINYVDEKLLDVTNSYGLLSITHYSFRKVPVITSSNVLSS